MQNHGSVYNSTNWWEPLETIGNKVVDLSRVHNIAPLDGDARTNCVHVIDEFLHLTSGGSASRNEDNVLSSFADHPASHTTAKPAGASNQNVCCISLEKIIDFL